MGSPTSSLAGAAADSLPSTQAPALDAAALQQLRTAAVRALNEALGPAAETTAIRMERARTETELRALVERAASMISAVRGGEAGRAYTERFLPKP